MAEAPEVQSQPASNAAEIFAQRVAELGLNQPEAEAPAETPAAFDPATFTIPVNANLPPHFEKYKGKPFLEVVENNLRTEQWASQKAQEAAQSRRENDDLRSRLAAAEQIAKMTPPAPPQNDWQRAGINPSEAIITDTERVFEVQRQSVLAEARRIATEESAKSQRETQALIDREKAETALFNTWETAKVEARKAGYEVSDDDWKRHLEYVAPVIERENRANPGVLFNPRRYVEHLGFLRGAPPKAQLPGEGNPPVAARSASVKAESVPTMNAETRALNKRIRAALNLPD